MADDFISKFHSIEGLTIGQRRKHFFSLLKQSESLKSQDVKNIVENLQAENYLETIFHVEFLIYFRQTPQLIGLLREGNDVIVSKILHHDWVIRAAVSDVTADHVVNTMLLTLSYVVRMKVMTKLSKILDCREFDAIYDCFGERYGKFLAGKFISGCSAEKIRIELSENPGIRITNVQLEKMYEKDATLLEFYFDLNKCYFGEFQSLLKRVFNENLDLFVHLREKFQFTVKFGYRSTKNYVDFERDEIVKKPKEFLPFLNSKAVIRKLGKDNAKFYCNLMPKQITKFTSYELIELLNKCPKKYHKKLFDLVETHFNIKLSKCSQLITEKTILFVKNGERTSWAQCKIQKGSEEYIKYLPCQESIPLIKKKIQSTSDSEKRAALLRSLVGTCFLNEDFQAFTNVLKYYATRHKNEHFWVFETFCSKIETTFDYGRFDGEMWDILNDLWKTHTLKSKDEKSPSINQQLFYLKFISGDNIEDLMMNFLDSCELYYVNFGRYGKQFELDLIKAAIKSKKTERVHSILRALQKFNRVHNEHLTALQFPELLESIEKNAQDPPYYIIEYIREGICNTDRLHAIYFDNCAKFANARGVDYFLKYAPLTLDRNFPKIMDFLTSDECVRLLPTIRQFSHLGFDTRLVEMCAANLNSDKAAGYVRTLSMLLPWQRYTQLAREYSPSEKKLDLNDEESVKIFESRCAFARFFKNTNSYEVFPDLMPFCGGDYFQSALGALYSVVYKTPEDRLADCLRILATNVQVTVKKHALFLTDYLCCFQEFEEVLTQFPEPQLKNTICKLTVRRFRKNPTEKTFALLEKNAKLLLETDEELLDLYTNDLCTFPLKYRPRFVQFMWNYLVAILKKENVLFQYQIRLLNCLDGDCVKDVPFEFIEQVVALGEDGVVMEFVFAAVAKHHQWEAILDFFLKRIDAEKSWKIFGDWSNYILRIESESLLKFLPKFLEFWRRKRDDPVEFFGENVKMFFLQAKLGFDPREFPRNLSKFIDETLQKFGLVIIDLLTDVIQECFGFFYTKTNEQLAVYFQLVALNNSPGMAAIILDLMPACGDDKLKEEISKIVNYMLENVNDLGIKALIYSKYRFSNVL